MELATSTLELTPGVQAEIQAPVPAGASAARRFIPAFYVNAGASITFKVTPGDPGRHRWKLNGQPIEAGAGAALALNNVGATGAGTYTVVIEEGGQRSVVDVATLTVVSDARLTHVSVRSQNDVNDRNLVVGFFIGGAGSKRVLLRSPGHAANPFSAEPRQAELVLAGWAGRLIAASRGGNNLEETGEVLPHSDDWIQPLSKQDAALVASLEAGGYSALVSGSPSADGSTVLELYDAEADPAAATSLSNVSGRAYISGPAGTLTVGFKIDGTASATVLIRGIGPSLQGLFGVEGALEHTQLVVRDADRRTMGGNLRWGGGTALAAAFAQAGAFALPPSSHDSALLLTLAPGAYVAELSGAECAAGVGLIEVYEVPAQ